MGANNCNTFITTARNYLCFSTVSNQNKTTYIRFTLKPWLYFLQNGSLSLTVVFIHSIPLDIHIIGMCVQLDTIFSLIPILIFRFGIFILTNQKTCVRLIFIEGGIMTKGQVEARISEAVSKFEIEYMGRGPKQIRTLIIQDLIIIRLKGFLSQSEQKLAENSQGVELLKKVRTILFENSRSCLVALIKEIVDVEVISTHSDVSTKTGEKIIVLTVGENLEEKLLR
jgi:uncharacterized protein YbcI